LADGDIEVLVESVHGSDITTKVIQGKVLFNHKGVNVPDTDLTTRGLTEKDIEDAKFGASHGVDAIAMSFVCNANDIESLRSCIGNYDIKIVAKIERKQALMHLDNIIDAADIVMVARGDLGVELPLEDVPLIQKDIIRKSIGRGKPSIVATQMLMSMVEHPRPTRAEVSDVANAVLDGAWGVMLSDETAFGHYPLQALDYLIKTTHSAEVYKMLN
jgi:pyruvate kinase